MEADYRAMTEQLIFEKLKSFIEKGNCFNYETRDLLIEYKNTGGTQELAEIYVTSLKETIFANNEVLQDHADDALDIITGFCTPDFRVWE